MIGARQLVHPRLRNAAAQFRPISHRQFLPRVSRNFQSSFDRWAHKPSSPIVDRLDQLARPLNKWLIIPCVLGYLAGMWYFSSFEEALTRPTLEPGSAEDQALKEELYETFRTLPATVELRSNPDFFETPVYGNYDPNDKTRRLTSGPLSSSGGLPLQRVFWNSAEKKAVNIVFFGLGTEGYPKLIHGGAIATVLDETLARVAIHHFPERTGVTANLDINYKKPALSHSFYTVYAVLDEERSTDRKAYVKGEVRNADGELCATASGLFLVPRGYKLQKLGDDY
ncbi:hypothetical protein BDV06DRAFT_204366 [Aspergillus oleicola]